MYRIAAEGCCRAVFLACWAGAINLFFFFSFLLLWSHKQRGSWDRCRLLSLQRSSPTDWHLYLKRDTYASTHSVVRLISWIVGIVSFCGCVWKGFVRTLGLYTHNSVHLMPWFIFYSVPLNVFNIWKDCTSDLHLMNLQHSVNIHILNKTLLLSLAARVTI